MYGYCGSGKLYHRTGRTACDNTGTFGSSLEQNAGAAELSNEVMGNALVLIHGNLHQILNSGFLALADCLRNLPGFAQANAYMAVSITNYYQSGNLMYVHL